MTERRRPAHPLWHLYERLAMHFGLSTLAAICLSWLPLALALRPLLPRPLRRRLGRAAIGLGFRFYLRLLTLFCACRFDFSELDRLRDDVPMVLAANHPSLLDAVLVLARLPRAACVMKADLMNNLLFGAAARLAGYIRNHPPLEMILRAREELQGGGQLLIFPEGTRTSRFPLEPCLPSAGLIASRAGVPVQTLLIEFTTPYLGKHWPLFRPPVLPLGCRIRLGRRFPPPQDVTAFTAELEAYFRTELAPAAVPA